MKILSTRDVGYAIVTGVTAGAIAWLILRFLQVQPPMNIPFAWLPLIIPTLWILGVQFGYFLGAWITFFDQFGKFVAIGFTNFAVDAGVLNLLLATTGIAEGKWYAVFKGISFIVAVIHSYFWNKFWAFQSSERGTGEFAKFFGVMLISIIINIGIASAVVNFISAPAGMDPHAWANVGAVIGSGSALIFSFIGFKLVVFRKQNAL